jgi:hypothetical protein
MRDLKSIYISKRFEACAIFNGDLKSASFTLSCTIYCQINVSMNKTLQQYILDKEMTFDNVTEVFKFGRKEYSNIHMEEV